MNEATHINQTRSLQFCVPHQPFVHLLRTPLNNCCRGNHTTQNLFFLYFVKYSPYQNMYQIKVADLNGALILYFMLCKIFFCDETVFKKTYRSRFVLLVEQAQVLYSADRNRSLIHSTVFAVDPKTKFNLNPTSIFVYKTYQTDRHDIPTVFLYI